MQLSLIDRVIQEEGIYVYNIHDIVEKHTRAIPRQVASEIII
jgi:hypothetical protein